MKILSRESRFRQEKIPSARNAQLFRFLRQNRRAGGVSPPVTPNDSKPEMIYSRIFLFVGLRFLFGLVLSAVGFFAGLGVGIGIRRVFLGQPFG